MLATFPSTALPMGRSATPVCVEQSMTAKLDSNRPVSDMVLTADLFDG
jgi:hypothetical protein